MAYHLLWEQLGDIVQRRDLAQTRDGGGDIRIPAARVVVEVKRTQARSVPAWLRQAHKSATLASLLAARSGKPAEPEWTGVVMWRRNGGQWQVFQPIALSDGKPGYRELTVPELCDWVRGRL
jgi:hypothetical protein